MLISETSEKQQKFQATFTDILNAKVLVLLAMKRCISFCVLFFPSYK